jgi:hypothetical protein
MMDGIVQGARPAGYPARVDAIRRIPGALLLLAPIVAVAAVAGVFTLSSRGDASLEYDQRHSGPPSARELELLIRKAREPTPEGPGSAARSVRCAAAGGAAPGQSAWSCSVRYGSGKAIRYRVTVRSNGAYSGADRSGQFLVNGCCVAGAGEG